MSLEKLEETTINNESKELKILKESLEKVRTDIEIQKTIYLIKNDSKNKINNFTSYKIYFKKDSKEHVSEIYSNLLNKINTSYCDIEDYNDENDNQSIIRISINHDLIKDSYVSFCKAIDDDKNQGQQNLKDYLEEIKPNAYVFVGKYKDNSITKNIYFITKMNYGNLYKKGIFHICNTKKNTLYKINEPILNFDYSICHCIIFDNTLYALNDNFMDIFNLESRYKTISIECVEIIKNSKLISNIEAFEKANPQTHMGKPFIQFSKDNLTALNDSIDLRKEIAKQYNFKLDSNNLFDLSDKKDAKNFINLLCNKLKVDSFDGSPNKVSNAKPLS